MTEAYFAEWVDGASKQILKQCQLPFYGMGLFCLTVVHMDSVFKFCRSYRGFFSHGVSLRDDWAEH